MTAGATARVAPSAVRQDRAVRRGGYALVSSSMLSSLAGVGYWWLAARAWSDTQVGQAAALISSMTLVAELASLGMTTGLVRRLPAADGGARGLIIRAYATAVGLAILGGLVGVVVLDRWADDLPQLDPSLAAWFVVGTIAWVLFVLQDGVLVGLGRTTVVPIENALFGAGRFVLALIVATAFTTTVASLYLTWIVPSAVGVAAMTVLILRRYAPRGRGALQPGLYRATVRFSIVNHVAAMLQRVWPMAMPVIVLSVLGAEASSHAFIAWSSAYALWLVSSGTGQALLAEAARTPTILHRLTGTALVQTLRLTIVGAAVALVAAPWYLSLFGTDYAAGGTTLLRLLAIAAVPNALTAVYLSAQRARGRLRSVLVVQAGLGLPALVLAVPVLRWSGLTGLGMLWLGNQLAVGLIVLVRGRWDLWIPALPVRLIGMVARLRHRTSAGTPTMRFDDETGEPTVVKAARGAAGVERMRREADHLRALHADDGLRALWPLVPGPPELDVTGDVGSVRLTAMSGVQASARDEAHLRSIHAAAALLHDGSARTIVVGDDELRRWVADRADVLVPVLHEIAPHRLTDLARLADELNVALAGSKVDVGAIHGDLSPANSLVDESSGALTAIVDWELAGFEEPIAVDVVQLLLSFPVARGDGELGQLAAETFVFGWSDDDRELLDVVGGDDALPASSRAMLMLTWLRHVAANVSKDPAFAHNRVWLVRNVLPMLDVIGDPR